VQIGTIGGSRAAAAATAALATDAKAARRADQLKKYGRGGSPEPGTGAAKKNVRLPRSIYARDLESHARAKAEREAREARARAPFVTARYGVKLPAPVASVQIGEKSAKARARRAALLAANQAKQMRLRPESAGPLRSVPGNAPGPWRVNANVAHDVTDPVSVAFNDAKRARAKAALRAKEEREKRDPAGLRAPRVDRSKYPSFKAWLDAQAAHDARLRAQMPGYADAARAANAKRREAAYVAKARAASGVPNAPGERKMIPESSAGDVKKTSPDPAPALNRFIALTEAFADASSGAYAGKVLSAEDQEKALMECAAEAAREAVEAAAAAASRASVAADRRDEDDAAAAAALVGEAAYEDEALLRQVAEVRTPTKASTEPFILGQNPRGSPRALFGASAFGSASAEATQAEPDPKPVAFRDDAAEKTPEERLADALSAMTPEERLAARAKASKGWSGDFTGVFYASKTAEGEDASASAAPTWSEKPKSPKSSRDKGSANDADDDDDDDAKVDTDALAVQFIGPNAAELAFRALNPDVPKEATFETKDGSKRKEAYASPGAVAAAAAAARAAEGLDPSDPASVAQCKARLAEMGIEFFGKQADAMAFQAVFPEHDVPKDPKDAKDAETPAPRKSGKDAFDPATPLAHQTGAAGLAVEFIGANAEELTRRALGGDDANGDDAGLEAHAVWSSDREAEALASALPSTPDAKPSPVEKRRSTETPLETETSLETAETAEALSAAQEEAWAKAEVAVPGTSAAPATLEANLEDARTAAGDVAAAEAAAAAAAARRDDGDDDELSAFSAQTDAAFAEAERASAIDAGSGAAVPTALVAPLAEDALRDAGAPGGGEL